MIESAGIFMYHDSKVFLVHPGGPFWMNKDKWGIPKGQVKEGESILSAAIREFQEETGIIIPTNDFIFIGTAHTSTKRIHAWAFEHHFIGEIKSNMFELEYKGKTITIPEVDKGQYFSFADARQKIHKNQLQLLENFIVYNQTGGQNEEESKKN